jgi:ribosome biogenesis GTPase
MRYGSDHDEERYYRKDNKETKREKKVLEKKDRSKFKKTDQEEPSSKGDLNDSLATGRVIAVESEGAIVYEESSNSTYACAVKGSLKYETSKEKNLITIGDFVRFEKLPSSQGHILSVMPRTSTLFRADNFQRRKMQLIAANIDQVLITISCVKPAIKPGLIDRYIIATLRGHMHPVILITKIDLIQDDLELMAIIEEIMSTYRKLGYTIFPVSTVTQEGLERLKEVMKHHSSVFSGQSGVGKTSLINCVTGLNLKTQEVIEKTMKGSHTTTKAQLVPLTCGGFCIDTPGIRSFGMWDLKKDEIQRYFPEIEEKSKGCKYKNCTHQSEPDCAVQKAVEKGKISLFRYESYLGLLSEEIPTDY